MPQRIYFVFLFVFITVGSPLFAQINVMPAQTALALSQKLTGKGVVIQNVTMTCPSQANGIFTASVADVGLDSGIVLTTGHAASEVSTFGVNGAAVFLASNNNGAPGDPLLDALAGETTHDACNLEFDVIPQGDTLKFDYVFSSEEYMNAVCGSYNDAFGFFISGPGISGQQNMALVPGTNIPVTINSVNSGVASQGKSISVCNAMGPGAPFSAYYVDNSHGLYLTHNGRTTVLQAIHDVTPCGVYHLKMVIADAGNSIYDSGVFLKAGSLQTSSYAVAAELPPVPPSPVDSLPFGVKGCLPAHFRVSRSVFGNFPQTIHYSFGGTAVQGVDFTVATDSVVIPANDSSAEVQVNGLVTPANGPKTVVLYMYLPFNCTSLGNSIIDSASLILYDTLHISMLTPDTAVCTGVYFPLRVNGPSFLHYRWAPQTGLLDPNLMDPDAMVQAAIKYTVAASLPGTSCVSNTTSVDIGIHQSPVIAVTGDAKICERQPLALNATVDPAGNEYSYLWTGPDGFLSKIPAPYISTIAPAGSGIYKVYVTNDTNMCVGIDSVIVTVIVTDTPAVVNPLIVCQNKQNVQLTAKGRDLKWYTSVTDSTGSDTAPVVPTATLGAYNYYVSQTSGGCESDKSEINALVEKCCDGNIFIPNAFTPNNDGLNDKFEVRADYGYTIEKLQVYNRWGQIIFDGVGNVAWDGRFGGIPGEIGNYFYYIKLNCINGGEVERKGTVVLIR